MCTCNDFVCDICAERILSELLGPPRTSVVGSEEFVLSADDHTHLLAQVNGWLNTLAPAQVEVTRGQ